MQKITHGAFCNHIMQHKIFYHPLLRPLETRSRALGSYPIDRERVRGAPQKVLLKRVHPPAPPRAHEVGKMVYPRVECSQSGRPWCSRGRWQDPRRPLKNPRRPPGGDGDKLFYSRGGEFNLLLYTKQKQLLVYTKHSLG